MEGILLTIDLNTPIIEENQKAYMVHPGRHYRLFGRFLRNHAIAPDLPELSVPDGKDPRSVADLDEQIFRARAIRDWLALPKDKRAETEVPTIDLNHYKSNDEFNKRAYHDNFIDNMRLILWGIPKNSTIFIPNPDLAGSGFFCELHSADEKRISFHGSLEAKPFKYLGRPIKNIKHVPMRLIPPEILAEKSRQSIVTMFDNEQSEKLYRLYYGSFSINNSITQIEIDIPSSIFRPADSNIVNGAANFFEDNIQKLEKGEINPTTFLDALFIAFDDTELQLHARLNSEGVVQIAAKSVSPLVLSILIFLAGEVSADDLVAELNNRKAHGISSQIKVINTKCSEDSEYPRKIENRLFGVLDMMGEQDLRLVCERLAEFKKRTGATTDIKKK